MSSMRKDTPGITNTPGGKKDSGRKKAPRADRAAGTRPEFERLRKIIYSTQDVCGICGKPVEKNDDGTFKYKAPHPLSPSIDHIIPLDKGGAPCALENMQLAHRICNSQKKNKILTAEVRDEREKQISNRILPLHADWSKK